MKKPALYLLLLYATNQTCNSAYGKPKMLTQCYNAMNNDVDKLIQFMKGTSVL